MSKVISTGSIRAIIVFAVAAVCATLVAVSVHVSLGWAARTETARSSQVTATVIQPAAPERSRPAIGRWTAPDGTRHVGVIPAPPERAAGAGHRIWINPAGQITAPPKSALHRGVQTVLAGLSVGTAIIIVTHRRSRQDDPIDMEWQNVAGEWRRRHL